jgi:hypothetical protein
MSEQIRRNDLLTYEPLTRDDGPAMTWSMHAIGSLELKDFDSAEKLFRRSYETYVRRPFNVSRLSLILIELSIILSSRYGLKLSRVLVLSILSRVPVVSYKRFSSDMVVFV